MVFAEIIWQSNVGIIGHSIVKVVIDSLIVQRKRMRVS